MDYFENIREKMQICVKIGGGDFGGDFEGDFENVDKKLIYVYILLGF